MRLIIFRPSVHHAMAHRVQNIIGRPASQPVQQSFQCRVMIGQIAGVFNQCLAAAPGFESPPRRPILSMLPDNTSVSDLPHVIQGTLQAGRAAVNRQNTADARFVHGFCVLREPKYLRN